MAARATTVDSILDRLAAAGRRRSAPRQAIVEILVRAKGHVTADELADDVQRRFPSVNISTVYRTLDTLEELGIVDHVHLGHGRAIYHLTDDDHQHLVCESCEPVQEIPLDKLRALFRTIERDYGFEVDRRHFAIVGVCRRCRTQKVGKR